MKRPKRITIEEDINDNIIELRLPNTHARYRVVGAAKLLWNTWKRNPDMEVSVQAVLAKYEVPEAKARADAEKLYADLDLAGLLED